MFDYLDKMFDFDSDGKLSTAEEGTKLGFIIDEILADNDDDGYHMGFGFGDPLQ